MIQILHAIEDTILREFQGCLYILGIQTHVGFLSSTASVVDPTHPLGVPAGGRFVTLRQTGPPASSQQRSETWSAQVALEPDTAASIIPRGSN